MKSGLHHWRLCLLVALLINTLSVNAATESKLIQFKASDGLSISADSYISHPSAATPLIILFHQAGSSRGEYTEIAPRLNRLGFNCIAVDQRAGEYSRNIDNLTAIRAGKAGLPTAYSDALPDIIAALRYAKTHYPHSKIIAWGSSYSAALVLKVAGDQPELVDAVIAFSPGEYFAHLGKSKTWIRDSAKTISDPVFITSARNESRHWSAIYQAIPEIYRHRFLPETAGKHGSKALWKKYSDSEQYWTAVSHFLKQQL